MNLEKFLKSDKNSRKIFGKRELKIIEKQLNGISLTQSEKNRLSRDIRKKFEFIKEVSKFEKEFELKKGENVKKIIDFVKEIILESHYVSDIKRIIVFGSFIEGKMTSRSDIDIAVVFSKIDKKEVVRFRLDILKKVNENVDIQVYNFLSEKIKKEIDEKGRVIYDRKN